MATYYGYTWTSNPVIAQHAQTLCMACYRHAYGFDHTPAPYVRKILGIVPVTQRAAAQQACCDQCTKPLA